MTDDAYRHLGPSALEVIALSPEERIVRMQGRRFTEYPRCRFVLDLMLEQLEQPAGTIKPNLLIWGESGQGKSTIMAKHLRDHPAVFDKKTGVRRTATVGLEMPPMCDVKWFYTQLLRAIDAPVNESRANIPLLADRVVTLYRLTGVRQILIDEAHNMLMGTLRQQRIMLTVIRHLSNVLGIPLVLFGTQDAREALMHDHQLTRRFRFVELPVWEAGEEFQTMVGSVLRTLPLRRPSTLTARSIRALLSHCGGTTAKLFETLIDLGIDAIQVGEERITADMVNEFIGRPGTG
ncbi:TniB family NTP-binding protein (plasmid) [Azospirillum oryzae]|uniref:TniB family NTP-binding protein n=1 Tax=Azospirillum oryzae TaxID=286727 RepID=A0A6N1ASL6_9PROT|nr:TniB family NTP-binding protein [Azospirillum oryzae]KAA0585431.1 AAA family ATPase [Azospirillum oryzae]QKS54586.1 TniB family NTP-binding protein [Azospirillum oryzae]GLR77465.1 transposition protein TniB [Azospirillum oryzae]